MEIISYKKNILGTMSFEMKLPGMRKAEKFTTYPVKRGDEKIYFQSSSRWAELDFEGNLEVSARHNFANSIALQLDKVQKKAKSEKITKENLDLILGEIRKTSGVNVGSSFVKCDNSGAAFI